ncbi:MAG: HAMP domain-containing histidine kinase [Actinobacteria bacterium]|nr:HAMP domain-containing histidine kinase [Actinomycetota bacterium]
MTAWLVGTVVGPPLFRSHLHQAGAGAGAVPQQLDHAELAFRSASAIALSTALLAAIAAALLVGAFVARRIGRSVAAASRAASGVAAGRYDVRMALPSLGREFDELAGAFNTMAGRLETVEATRRRLLADLAHEMRTPVATLDAYLEGLEDGVARLDGDTVAILRAQTARLARLCGDIGAVSGAEEHQLDLRPAPVAPAALVHTAVAVAADRYAAKGVALDASVTAGLPAVTVDTDRIGQVLGNLLDNALRHTPTGGRVTVTATPASRRDEIVLTVRDTGDGIAANHLPHVFERFYRADRARDRARGGSGIGLAIARALVDAHGGRIAASSGGPGQGTTVRVALPAGRRAGRSTSGVPGRAGSGTVGSPVSGHPLDEGAM